MNIKIRKTIKQDQIRNEERGDHFDEIYGFESLKALQRGVISELEKQGLIKSTDDEYFDIKENETIEVSTDNVIKKYYKIKSLDNLIKSRINKLKRLNKAIESHECEKPTGRDLMNYCNSIIRTSKGKLKEPLK